MSRLILKLRALTRTPALLYISLFKGGLRSDRRRKQTLYRATRTQEDTVTEADPRTRTGRARGSLTRSSALPRLTSKDRGTRNPLRFFGGAGRSGGLSHCKGGRERERETDGVCRENQTHSAFLPPVPRRYKKSNGRQKCKLGRPREGGGGGAPYRQSAPAKGGGKKKNLYCDRDPLPQSTDRHGVT